VETIGTAFEQSSDNNGSRERKIFTSDSNCYIVMVRSRSRCATKLQGCNSRFDGYMTTKVASLFSGEVGAFQVVYQTNFLREDLCSFYFINRKGNVKYVPAFLTHIKDV